MIRIANKEIADFIDYLNKNNPEIPDVYIYIIPGFPALEAPDGTPAFAVYNSAENTIIVAGEPTDGDIGDVLQCIAHEFFHHTKGHDKIKPEYEKEAEQYSLAIINKYLRAGLNNVM